jgi:hypothetical protein
MKLPLFDQIFTCIICHKDCLGSEIALALDYRIICWDCYLQERQDDGEQDDD